ncbi:hypothetical protein V500_01504 [Pseudogymnoascus sp. VKM F-4518 (FW-2643)]|nr:hypothetical protein V500_01504 [Pseudogymnoascus sp. VKM F-4518 (FW-2643)]
MSTSADRPSDGPVANIVGPSDGTYGTTRGDGMSTSADHPSDGPVADIAGPSNGTCRTTCSYHQIQVVIPPLWRGSVMMFNGLKLRQ